MHIIPTYLYLPTYRPTYIHTYIHTYIGLHTYIHRYIHTYIHTAGTGVAQLVARSTPDRCVVGSSPTHGTGHFGFPPVFRDWVIKGLGMSSLLYATGHIKDPVPLIEKRRGLSLGSRFPPSFIHQIIIITGLNKLYNCMFSPWRWP